jgi:hypothetical protein
LWMMGATLNPSLTVAKEMDALKDEKQAHSVYDLYYRSAFHGVPFPSAKKNFACELRCIDGTMTFSITTLSIMTFSKMTLSIMTLSIMTLSIMTLSIMLSIMTLSIMTLNAEGC